MTVMNRRRKPISSDADQESGGVQAFLGDDEYYRGRELQELKAAMRSPSLNARQIHQQLAQSYAERRLGIARDDNDGGS
jgi:hypothetical protein